MIEVENIVYEYPGKIALRDVSFTIKAGSITALVGPNGAGKTTLMRCIAALDVPFSGKIFVDGVDAFEYPRTVHKKIGYLSDFFGVYGDLTVEQCLTYVASIQEIDKRNINHKIQVIAKDLNLTNYLKVKVGELSRGLRQRLGIAQAVIHAPKLLLLDEPASGLDPEARISLSVLFKTFQQQGMTLLVSSHILSELEDYCSDMLLLRDGKLVDHCSKTSSQKELQEHKITMLLYEDVEKYKDELLKIEDLDKVFFHERELVFSFFGDEEALSGLLKKIINKNIPVYSFMTKKKRLQDIYMDYVEQEISDVSEE